MILIFLGKPGSGKGTQAELVSRKLRIPVVSIGEMLRSIEKGKGRLAQVIRQRIDKGMLLPDNIIINIVKKRIAKRDCKRGYILDGFPRTLKQAKMFNEKIDMVIYIDVSDRTIIKRLSSRRECSCGAIYNMITNPPKIDEICDRCGKKLYKRKDDAPKVVRKRLAIYKKQTNPLINFYKNRGIIVHVDGNKNINDIFNSIMRRLRTYERPRAG